MLIPSAFALEEISIFEQLKRSDELLLASLADFRKAAESLAAKNGSGDPIRDRIRRTLAKITEKEEADHGTSG